MSSSPDETEKIAARFAASLSGGEKIGLCGPLGAGKTRFMQGVARALPLVHDEPLSSPSFSIVNEYPLKTGGTLYHMDLYRLDTWAAFLEIDGQGLLNQVDKRSFLFIEWAERYPQLLSQMDWTIALKELEGDMREIKIQVSDKNPKI